MLTQRLHGVVDKTANTRWRLAPALVHHMNRHGWQFEIFQDDFQLTRRHLARNLVRQHPGQPQPERCGTDRRLVGGNSGGYRPEES